MTLRATDGLYWIPLAAGIAVLDLATKGSSHPLAVAAVSALTIVGLVWWLAHTTSTAQRAAMAVAVGGAVANLVGRTARGAVTDWIHVRGYPPTFNFADVAIRGGMIAAVLLALGKDVARDKAAATVPGDADFPR